MTTTKVKKPKAKKPTVKKPKTKKVVRSKKAGLPVVEETLPVEMVPTPASAMTLIDSAVKQGLTAETLEKLYDLHERITDRQETRLFHQAIGGFQSECPTIKRNKQANISTRSGASFKYHYAELEEIERCIRPALHKNGLSYSWDSEVDVVKGSVSVTCVLRHVEGHTISARFSSPVDTRANESISGAQKHGAALTYARRQSLIQVLGLRVGDPDTDGKEFEKIAESQLVDLQAIMEETGIEKRPKHLARLLKYLDITSIEELSNSNYEKAVNALNEYRRQNHD